MRFLILSLVAALAASFAHATYPSRSASVTHTFAGDCWDGWSITSTYDWPHVVPGFDSSLGTLTAVEVCSGVTIGFFLRGKGLSTGCWQGWSMSVEQSQNWALSSISVGGTTIAESGRQHIPADMSASGPCGAWPAPDPCDMDDPDGALWLYQPPVTGLGASEIYTDPATLALFSAPSVALDVTGKRNASVRMQISGSGSMCTRSWSAACRTGRSSGWAHVVGAVTYHYQP